MKTRYIIFISALALLAASCNKDYQVAEPSLEVSLPCLTVKVGESVDFALKSSKLDMLTFFSGEEGAEYKYRDNPRIVPCGDLIFSFMTAIPSSTGPTDAPNPARVPLTYSTDFNGNYTKEDMEKATWTDISDRFTFATKRGQASVMSGDVVINDLFPDKNTPIYFRFEYIVEAYDAALSNGRSYWQIYAPTVSATFDGVLAPVYDIYAGNWQMIPGDGYSTIPSGSLPMSPNINGTEYLYFRTQFQVGNYDYDRGIPKIEEWFVSAPLKYVDDANLGRSKGLAIKAVADPQLTSYSYSYTQPGEYEATFVGINANFNGHKEAVSSIRVKVVEDEGSISGPTYDEWTK